MGKIALRLDDLQVETFDTLPHAGRNAGTVYARDNDSTAPCWAATIEGSNCDSTQFQDLCTCTGGGPNNTTCDVNLSCGGPDTCGCAATDPRYNC
jgi:hypothetical protein